ncbi:MAG TPA: DPP IV N-terminal domain-containing protein, partial [Draconibacterium sp.]|nr:DPP IV N-terminal domain-containing protein [Draconibacterium sp.]
MKLSFDKSNLMISIILVLLFQLSDITYTQAQRLTQSLNSTAVPEEAEERLREIFEGSDFSVKTFRAEWFPNSSAYLVIEYNSGDNCNSLVQYDLESGKSTILLNSRQLVVQGDTGLFEIGGYQLSPEGGKILVQANRLNSKQPEWFYWMLDIKSRTLKKVEVGNNNKISPNGQKILFNEKGNFYLSDLQNNTKLALTNSEMNDAISFGNAVFSPNGKKIAFVKTDVSNVKIRSSLVPGDPSYPGVKETRFARIGGNIPELNIGVIDDRGLETRWLSVPVPIEGYYLGQVSWAGNSEELLVEQFSRFRDKREFFIVNVNNGEVTSIYKESDPAWVVASYGKNIGLEWI